MDEIGIKGEGDLNMTDASRLHKKVRVLIIEGSASPPSFVRNLIFGLARHPMVHVAVLAKSGATKYLPDITVLKSDFKKFSRVRVISRLVVECLTRPGRIAKAVRLTTPARSFKEWLKGCYRIVLILSFNPEILHFQWATHAGPYLRLVQEGRFKCVVSLRGSQINVRPIVDPLVNELYRKIFPKCHLHAVSGVMKDKVIKYGVAQEHIKVIYSSVPKSFFDAYDDCSVVKGKPLKILSIGRFHWIKGYWYAIEGVNLLRHRGMEVHYTMVLKGGPSQEILYQISDRGLRDVVSIIDGIPYSEVTEFMKRHDVLLLSSVEEGIANVVVEAMAVGLPVISTDCGGMREVVIDGETGWLVPIRNSVAIADALEKFMLLSDADIFSIRRKAHALVKSKFSAERNVQLFCDWYADIARKDGELGRGQERVS